MKSKSWFGIRLQFLILVVLVMGTIIGVDTYVTANAQREAIFNERKLRGFTLLRSWVLLSRERLATGDVTMELSMYDFVDNAMKNEQGIVEIYVQDIKGNIILHNDPKLNNTVRVDSLSTKLMTRLELGVTEGTRSGQSVFAFHAPIIAGDKPIGQARIVFNSAGIEEGIRESIIYLLTVSGIVFLIGILLTSFMVYRITGPIKLLASGVREFGKRFDPAKPETADYQIQYRARNELGEVRDAFNEMTQTLKSTLEERVRLAEEKKVLKAQATTDGLTGLYNKRQFLEDIVLVLAKARERNVPVTMMMLDMDLFKKLNDTVGHAAGDKALQDVAKAVKARIRDTDRAYRIGGDEFIILLGGVKYELAFQLSQRIAEEYARIKDPENLTTISAGIVEYDRKESHEEFSHRADEEMYRVKREKKAKRE